LEQLYDIIKKIHSKEVYSLFDFLDAIVSNLSFMLEKKILLEFKVYSIIDKQFLNKYNRAFEANEIELDFRSHACISLIADILSNKFKGNELLFICLITLKYRSFYIKFKEINLTSIIKAFKSVEAKKVNLNKVSNKELFSLICTEIANNNSKIIKEVETYNIDEECKESTFKKSNLIDLDSVSSNIKNLNGDKFGDNIYKIILDELIKKISNNTKMDEDSKKEMNQKFNQLKEFLNKLIENNKHLKEEINSIKEDNTKLMENGKELKLKINDMDIQIGKLKEDSKKKEKELNSINNKLDKIYENLVCPISLSIFEEPVICPSGIT